jgi:ATP-dependent Zn protease
MQESQHIHIGFSGAELANVVDEGCLLAARGGREAVILRDLLEGAARTKCVDSGAAWRFFLLVMKSGS